MPRETLLAPALRALEAAKRSSVGLNLSREQLFALVEAALRDELERSPRGRHLKLPIKHRGGTHLQLAVAAIST